MKARFTFTLVVAGMFAACSRQRATPEACAEILDRIVAVELREMGFRDPALLERKRSQLRQLLAPDLKRCQGRPLPVGALACVRRAGSTEEISHRCLR